MIFRKKSTNSDPWDSWIPGVLSWKQVGELIEHGYIEGGEDKLLDNSALDLTLSSDVYEMVRGSVKPQGLRYLHTLKKEKLVKKLDPDNNGYFLLTVRRTYLIKLRENVGNLAGSGIFGQATAKSSVGRMDVLARLVVDGMNIYESFDHSSLQKGEMFVEITPMTFNVLVKEGISLIQLRFFKGSTRKSEMQLEELFGSVLANTASSDGSLSVDLEPLTIGGNPVSAFRVRRMIKDEPPIPLWTSNDFPPKDPSLYWHFELADKNKRFTIKQNEFYIMRSKEKIHLPQGIAVYCRATDETIGEMRIHYAGFVHPYFGQRDDAVGTPLIFEVRGHDVDVTLSDGEKMATLLFYRMSEDCKDKKEDQKKVYNDQTLKLSNFFAAWPDKFNLDAEGKVDKNAE